MILSDRPLSDDAKMAEVIDELPYDTSLHKAMIHLPWAGGHVHSCSGRWGCRPDGSTSPDHSQDDARLALQNMASRG